MVMKRRTQKDTLFIAVAEADYHINNRMYLKDKDATYDNKQQLSIQKYRRNTNYPSKGQRANISHKYLCGMAVEPQKAKASSTCCCQKDSNFSAALNIENI